MSQARETVEEEKDVTRKLPGAEGAVQIIIKGTINTEVKHNLSCVDYKYEFITKQKNCATYVAY